MTGAPQDPPPLAAAARGGKPEAEGGETACWLSLVCPECGAIPDRPPAAGTACPRCGAPRG